MYVSKPECSSTSTMILKAYKRGGKQLRWVFYLCLVCAAVTVLAIVLWLLGYFAEGIVMAFGVIGAAGTILLVVGIAAYQRAAEEAEIGEKLREAEQEAREHPEKPRAAWDLARFKLESYLDRNLSHVKWIFVLVLAIMTVGFCIIGYGIFRVYEDPAKFKASIVVTCSGIIVEFIGATFLLIYRSTMAQAREYVNVLERINAVGMSAHILESIEDPEAKMRDQARADIAKELLNLYAQSK